MPLGGHYDFGQRIDRRRWEKEFQDFHSRLAARYPVLLVCHNKEEYRYAAELFPGSQLFIANTSYEYLNCYSRARYFIGCRVHGAFAAASFGRPALVIGNDSRARMMEQIGLKSLFVNEVDCSVLMDSIEELEAKRNCFPDQMAAIKNGALLDYLRIFEPIRNLSEVTQEP
jgi:hypothetical protein